MKDISSTSFGYLIAFLLPGIFGIYALGIWFSSLDTFLKQVLKTETSVGLSFIFLLIAIGVGVCISGLRYFIFEWKRCTAENNQGMSAEELTVRKTVVDEHYRYHQFYGGCTVALLVLYSGWLKCNHATITAWQFTGWTI